MKGCRLAGSYALRAIALLIMVTSRAAVMAQGSTDHTSTLPVSTTSVKPDASTSVQPKLPKGENTGGVSTTTSTSTGGVSPSSKMNIPIQSAASITPSASSAYSTTSHSTVVTYHTTESSTTASSTVRMKDSTPLSSVRTPSLVLTVSPEDDILTVSPPVTVESGADKTVPTSSTTFSRGNSKSSTSSLSSSSSTLDSLAAAHITSSFSVPSETSAISSSHIMTHPTPTDSLVLVSSPSSGMIQSSIQQIVPSPTADVFSPTATLKSTIEAEVMTSTERLSTTELITTERTTSVTEPPTTAGSDGSDISEPRKETTTVSTTEKSVVSTSTTSAETTEVPETTSINPPSLDSHETSSTTTQSTPKITHEATTETTTELEEETTSESTTTSKISTQSSSRDLTTAPVTYEPLLNTSSAYDDFWIVTVLKIPLEEDVTTRVFVNGMEMKLARLFYDSLVGRVKRAATFKNATTVQMIMVNRSESSPQHTSLTYYVMHKGIIIPAREAVRIINNLSSQRLAIVLGYEVISMGEVYKKGPDRKLWIIGAVIGALVVLVSLIWCVLFIYYKCTRPAGKRSPRSSRTNRTIDPERSFRTQKDFRVSQRDLRGFDIVRTEVGLESEIMREKGRSSDSYRRMAGSSELEGMYSPGDTPPPDAPLVQPSHDAGVSSRPNSKVHSLSRPLPSLPGSIGRKGKGKKTREESSEGETTGSEKPLTPANKNQGRKKGRAWSKGHSEDSDEDSDDEDGGPIRTSMHGVRLPPIPNPPYLSESHRESLRHQQELEDSMKNKAESERQRNKQRQRDKKKEKKSKKDLKKEAEAKKAYKMVQKEMGQMLEEHSAHQPNVFIDDQKNKAKKKKVPTATLR